MKTLQKLREAREYQFLWVWRFLLNWGSVYGVHRRKNWLTISLFAKDHETELFEAEINLSDWRK